MKTMNELNEVKATELTEKAWVRGIELTFTAKDDHLVILIKDVIVDQQPIVCENREALKASIETYKKALNEGRLTFQIPRARKNAVEEFVYQTEEGNWLCRSGYTQLEWSKEALTPKERESGVFFLRHTNVILGTLMIHKQYAVIQFIANGEPRVWRHLSMDTLKALSSNKDWMQDYIHQKILIFEEDRAMKLPAENWNPFYVEALNQNSAYKLLPYPLTATLKNYYFSRQELKKRIGYDVQIAKVVPSGYTIKQTQKGDVQVTHYYHSDLVPQSFLCKCGEKKQQTGPLSERICWTCLESYKHSCIKRSVQYFKQEWRKNPSLETTEPVFVVMHANKGSYRGISIRELINICVVDSAGNVLFESLIQPKGRLSKKNRQRGYHPERFESAPTFEEIHEHYAKAIRGKTVVFFNAAERQAIYESVCSQQGIEAEAVNHLMCLKEILIPISYGMKRINKLSLAHGVKRDQSFRGLKMECDALGISFPLENTIARDAQIMCQLYHVLVRQVA